jgi:hypothetical protein
VKAGVIQSCFVPWRGFFDFIGSVDLFVFHDDIQYTKGDWRNRNKLKTSEGTSWITVPVHYRSVEQLICDTHVDESTDWRSRHTRLWRSHYMNAPFLDDLLALLGDLDRNSQNLTISTLNIGLIRRIMEYLNISTPLTMSTDYQLKGYRTERLIDLLRKTGAKKYLSGPAADVYLDKEAFRKAGIGLEYKSYDYEPYPQLWGKFIGEVTVLDLIANCGPQAKKYVQSRSPNIVVF